MSAHAKFSASSASRWIACPASIVLQEGKPDNSSEAARKGTAAHELAAWCLTENAPANDRLGRFIEVEGHKIEIDLDMAQMVQDYVDYCLSLRAIAQVEMVEYRVDYSEAIDQPDSFGTADYLALIDHELVVVDLKTGHRKVEPDGPQLKLYAVGALAEFDLMYQIDQVRLVIFQPAHGGVSEYVVTIDELNEFARHASGRAHLAVQENAAQFTSPGSHCGFCKAQATCPALRGEVLAVASRDAVDDFADLTVADVIVPNEGDILASVLPKLTMIENWVDAVRLRARQVIMEGGTVPGWKMVTGKKGNRAWTDEAAVEATFKSMRLKVDEMYDLKLISPTKAEALLKGTPKRWNRVKELYAQKDGSPTLAPASDERPAIEYGKPEDDFTNLEEEACDLA